MSVEHSRAVDQAALPVWRPQATLQRLGAVGALTPVAAGQERHHLARL